MSAAGGPPTSIYMDFPTIAYGARPMWLPDGSTITFSTSGVLSGARSILALSNGAAARLLLSDAYDAAWSPIGGRIAFVSTGGK